MTIELIIGQFVGSCIGVILIHCVIAIIENTKRRRASRWYISPATRRAIDAGYHAAPPWERCPSCTGDHDHDFDSCKLSVRHLNYCPTTPPNAR